jgi:hypothetical protein
MISDAKCIQGKHAYSWNAGAAEPMTLFIQKLFVTVSIRLINSTSIMCCLHVEQNKSINMPRSKDALDLFDSILASLLTAFQLHASLRNGHLLSVSQKSYYRKVSVDYL